jgi:pimeloyl-ACP methyl ester carboxylesterase
MSITTENVLKLRDGRRLGYAEYGDPNGRPVLHFHGFPSSRYEGCRLVFDEIATRLKARVIVLERPGFGLSDFKAGRRLVDWPQDVVEFADALRLDRFAVTGFSGGGPYAAACAWKLPRRITRAGIISGASPLEAPGALDGMNRIDRLSLGLARRAPWLLRLAYGWIARNLQRHPARTIAQYVRGLTEPDRAAFAQADVLDVFSRAAVEGLRAGGRGVTWDSVLLTRPWGFPLQEISIPVHAWQGQADDVVPPSQGRFLAKNIPNCQARFVPNEGHISLFNNHYEEILGTIVG